MFAGMVSVDHRLRILHAPQHGPSFTLEQARLALNLGACSVGFTEAYRLIPALRRRPRWRIAVGHSETSRRGPGDVPVMVRRHHKPVDRWALKACEAAEPLRLAPERWITGFAYRHPLGVIEHIATHPDPIMAPAATLSMRREYREHMRQLETALHVSLELGRIPVLTGDLNVGQRRTPDFAPLNIIQRAGLEFWCVGVDWIAWHPSLVPVRRQTIPREEKGHAGHPWLWIDFEGFRGRP